MIKKTLSTFEREMKDEKFRKVFEKEYAKLSLSEIVLSLMKENHKTVRGLAHETALSPTIIQRVRSGEQDDLKVSNLLSIAAACGYHLYLEKGGNRIVV